MATFIPPRKIIDVVLKYDLQRTDIETIGGARESVVTSQELTAKVRMFDETTHADRGYFLRGLDGINDVVFFLPYDQHQRVSLCKGILASAEYSYDDFNCCATISNIVVEELGQDITSDTYNHIIRIASNNPTISRLSGVACFGPGEELLVTLADGRVCTAVNISSDRYIVYDSNEGRIVGGSFKPAAAELYSLTHSGDRRSFSAYTMEIFSDLFGQQHGLMDKFIVLSGGSTLDWCVGNVRGKFRVKRSLIRIGNKTNMVEHKFIKPSRMIDLDD